MSPAFFLKKVIITDSRPFCCGKRRYLLLFSYEEKKSYTRSYIPFISILIRDYYLNETFNKVSDVIPR